MFFGNVRGDTTWQKGSYGFVTVLHEMGHALGLSHPHEDDGFGKMPERTDFLDNTVMSYRSCRSMDPAIGYQNNFDSHPQSLMPIDLLAIQYLYGINTQTRSGGTTYSWDPATGEKSIDGVAQGAPVGDKVYETIWDGGGDDTYDFTAYTTGATGSLKGGASITLSPAHLARVGTDAAGKAIHAGGSVFNAYDNGGFGNHLIENVRLGSGDDSLKGNLADNVMDGNDGNDTLDGTSGMDAVRGGAGNDSLDGGVGDDSLDGGGDDDMLKGGDGDDQFRFAAGDGADRIKEFDAVDRIDLTAIVALADIDDLTFTEANGGLLVDYGAGTILLLGRVRADFDGGNFLFS
jgi:serralysin